jgi:glycolate oxidase FAD binding subunit
LGIFLDLLRKTFVHQPWQFVAQAVGAGHLRLSYADADSHTDGLLHALQDLRCQLEARGGSLVLLRCPLAIKSKLDVWGSCGDALPLMKNIKSQFDPTAVLNPGRYVGGI